MRRAVFLFIFLVTSFTLVTTSTSLAENRPRITNGTGLSVGIVDFTNSCAPEMHQPFNQGLAMLHHMMYAQSRERFQSLAADFPDCAMLQWAIAMTYLHPLWAPPNEVELRKGEAAVLLAESLHPTNEREKEYIHAIERYYHDWQNTTHPERLAGWAEAQAQLAEKYPDDIDAAAFNALAHLAIAPKDDKTFAHQKHAGAILEKIYQNAPRHPAGYHYLIHAYDNPVFAERALEVARAYGTIAPDVPHALHMPSHIFVRLGLWDEVVTWNTRSAEAAWNQPVGDEVSLHFAHAIDYLVYGYMQRGNIKKAVEEVRRLLDVESFQDSFASAYALAAAQARVPMEQGHWQQAADLPLRSHTNFPWDNYPWFEAITYFSKGIGAARNQDPTAAVDYLDRLEEIYLKSVALQQEYWAVLVDSKRHSVAAWTALAEGNEEEALSLMIEAADLEDSVDKHPVTPGAVLPARELLGDMLFILKRYDEAGKAYERALSISANRLRSLHGAARSAEMTGNTETARHYYTRLQALQNDSSADRQEFRNAAKFLK